MHIAAPPVELHTARLWLRCWRGEDAAVLQPVLEANVAHLERWIPARVGAPAPLPELKKRLERFADDFRCGRAWRWALFSPAGDRVIGEISLFPRTRAERVAFPAADRLEIGYWLRSDETGRGYASEAARAMLVLASGMPAVHCVEIRCDPMNLASAAVPKRLGFRLEETGEAAQPRGEALDIWIFEGLSSLSSGGPPADPRNDGRSSSQGR